MEIKNTLLVAGLMVLCLFLAYWGWGQKSKAGELLDYSRQLESVNDSLLTNQFTLNNEIVELKSINAKRLDELDELGKQLEDLQFELISVINTTVSVDTVMVEGIADTIYISPEEIVYSMYELNSNYKLEGTLTTPSGEYKIKITQMPFGLELREVTTPTGRKRVYARVIGRDDLTIEDIDFKASEHDGPDKDIWALGPGVIVSESGVDWGVNVKRDRFSVIGTRNSLAASWELLRF